jgi:hypothetical protein
MEKNALTRLKKGFKEVDHKKERICCEIIKI